MTILTLIALLSSFGSIIFAAMTDSASIFFFDMTLNTLCLMLMTNYYKGWYRKLCCCCISCCILCIFCDKEQQKMYQDHMDKSKIITKSPATDNEGNTTRSTKPAMTITVTSAKSYESKDSLVYICNI